MSGIEAAFFGVLGRDLRLNVRIGDGEGAQ